MSRGAEVIFICILAGWDDVARLQEDTQWHMGRVDRHDAYTIQLADNGQVIFHQDFWDPT